MKFSYRSLIGASLALIGSFAGIPAEAADFQQYAQGACSGQVCKVNFVMVPDGRRLRVTHASCYARVTTSRSFSTGNLYAMQLLLLNSAGVGTSAQTLTTSRVGEFRTTPGYTSVYQGHDEVQMMATALQRIQAYVQISEGDFDQVACHVSGDLS